MKNNKKILLLTISVMSLCFVFYILNEIQNMRHVQNALHEIISDLQEKDNFYTNNFEISNKMNGLFIPDVSYIDNDRQEKIAKLAKTRPVLICMYKISCSTCSKDEIIQMQNVFKDITDVTYILCSLFIKRELYIYTRQNKINIPVFGIAQNSFDWIAEEDNKTYFFVLHPDMKISHIYISDIKYPELNRQYLEGVKRFFSELDNTVFIKENFTDHDCDDH